MPEGESVKVSPKMHEKFFQSHSKTNNRKAWTLFNVCTSERRTGSPIQSYNWREKDDRNCFIPTLFLCLSVRAENCRYGLWFYLKGRLYFSLNNKKIITHDIYKMLYIDELGCAVFVCKPFVWVRALQLWELLSMAWFERQQKYLILKETFMAVG